MQIISALHETESLTDPENRLPGAGGMDTLKGFIGKFDPSIADKYGRIVEEMTDEEIDAMNVRNGGTGMRGMDDAPTDDNCESQPDDDDLCTNFNYGAVAIERQNMENGDNWRIAGKFRVIHNGGENIVDTWKFCNEVFGVPAQDGSTTYNNENDPFYLGDYQETVYIEVYLENNSGNTQNFELELDCDKTDIVKTPGAQNGSVKRNINMRNNRCNTFFFEINIDTYDKSLGYRYYTRLGFLPTCFVKDPKFSTAGYLYFWIKRRHVSTPLNYKYVFFRNSNDSESSTDETNWSVPARAYWQHPNHVTTTNPVKIYQLNYPEFKDDTGVLPLHAKYKMDYTPPPALTKEKYELIQKRIEDDGGVLGDGNFWDYELRHSFWEGYLPDDIPEVDHDTWIYYIYEMTYDELITANSIQETEIPSDTTAFFDLNVVVPLSPTGTPPGTYEVSIISIKEENIQMNPLFFHHQDYWDTKKITVDGNKSTSADIRIPSTGDATFAPRDSSIKDFELVEFGDPSWSGGSPPDSPPETPDTVYDGGTTLDSSIDDVVVKDGQLTLITQGKKIKFL